jgi:hypothetical protein
VPAREPSAQSREAAPPPAETVHAAE